MTATTVRACPICGDPAPHGCAPCEAQDVAGTYILALNPKRLAFARWLVQTGRLTEWSRSDGR
jgi:hypothetical protein